jgi:hypothetical protein
MGWQLVGITPGFDREVIAPGNVKRVLRSDLREGAGRGRRSVAPASRRPYAISPGIVRSPLSRTVRQAISAMTVTARPLS